MTKRTNADIRADINATVASIIEGEEGASFPLLLEEAEDKVIACLHVLTTMHAEVLEGQVHLEAAKSFIDRRKKAIDRLETEIHLTMEAMGENKIDRPDGRVTVVAGRPMVQVLEAGKIPLEYQRVIPEKREPDKARILADLKAGKEVPGTSLGTGAASLRYEKPKAKGEPASE